MPSITSDESLRREHVTHVLDEKRRTALADVDHAPFSQFHLKVCFVAGIGFFTDAYDTFAIDIAVIMLGYRYGNRTMTPQQKAGQAPFTGWILSPNQEFGIKAAAPMGTFIGQIIFGRLADIVGRKRMYGIELIFIVLACFSQSLAGGADAVNILGVIIFWRFIMGIGIGGDYPLSAVITSEFAAIKSRGRLMTAVFAAQGWGNFASALVSLIVVSVYKNGITHDDPTSPRHVDTCWRLLIGLGCVPGVIALYFRLTIPETPRFTMDIERNINQASGDVETFLTTGTFTVDPDAIVQRADAPKASRRDFAAYFSRWDNFKVLFGTSYSWFALDIAFYGLGLNTSAILEAIDFQKNPNSHGAQAMYENLRSISVGKLILAVAGLIPGYYASMLFIDSWGRKPIQLMGFIILTVLFIVMGFGYDAMLNHSQVAFVFLYCLANFFQNFGPNTTTFIVPGEAFPTRYRSTAHGIAAASGKLGAIVAQGAFAQKDYQVKDKFLKHILEIFAFFMLTGIFSTLLIPETKRRTLEDISNERQDDFIRGVIEVEVRDGLVVDYRSTRQVT